MSTLISSAVAGKKAAPKAPPRRRAAPPPATGKASTPISVSSAQTSVAPPSPPATQQTQPPAPAQPVELPTPAQVVEQTAPAQPPAPQAPPQIASSQRQEPTPIRIEVPPVRSTQESPAPTHPVPTRPSPPHQEQHAKQDDELPDLPIPQPSKKRAREEAAPVKETAQPAKRVKRSSARSNVTVQAAVQEEEAPAARPKATKGRNKGKRKAVQFSVDPALAATADTRAPAPKRKQTGRRSKRLSAANVVDSDAEDEPFAQDGVSQATNTTAATPRRRRRTKKAQETQPEAGAQAEAVVEDGEQAEPGAEQEQEEEDDESDPELHEIDPNTVSMYELSRNRKNYGKTSDLEKQMGQIDWAEVARKNREKIEALLTNATADKPEETTQPSSDIRETTEGPNGTADKSPSAPPEVGPTTPPPDASDLLTLDSDGNIIYQEEGPIDRQKEAEAAALTDEPAKRMDAITNRVNRMTYVNQRRREAAERMDPNRIKSEAWNENLTDRFYSALQMFGTDFQIICKMFPPKTRKQIKAKFTREERLDPARVNAALMGKEMKKSMDLEFYARETGRDVAEFTKYEDAEHAERVIREGMKEREAAMHEAIREEDEQEEQRVQAQSLRDKNRKKAAERREARAKEGLLDRDRNGGGRGKGRKKKGAATMGGGGPQEAAEGAAAAAGG
ncbi:hypothetical protein LTR37_006198 [Vermiconidia calcicola]|uniref:Uncharacterized protein n=1 Tax=Vermiconidia calcicola TaxID=1690605 RepID=A0ACC3NGX1_9PEZI|nr:hypothetical protein LTR37_006198 [Vermiconidia calcicola]